MKLLSPEQLASTQKARLDSMFILASKTLDGWQKLIDQNLQATRSTLTDAQERLPKARPFNDPQAARVLQMSLIGPPAEKIQTYNGDLYGIVASTQAELAAAAGTQFETHHRNVQTALASFMRSAPAGSKAAIAAVKSTISSANTLSETVRNTVQQAAKVTGSSIEATLNGASEASRQAGGPAPLTAKA